MTALQAIRKKCLDCCAGAWKEVRLCPSKDCPLWPFRFGKKPPRAKRGQKTREEIKK